MNNVIELAGISLTAYQRAQDKWGQKTALMSSKVQFWLTILKEK